MYFLFFLLVLCPFSYADPETYRLLNLFSEVFRLSREKCANPIDDQHLIESAIRGMVRSVDANSDYLSPERYAELKTRMKGELQGGVGLEVSQDQRGIKIIEVLPDTPAERASLRAGDILVAIDEKNIKDLDLEEVVEKLRGPAKTTVKITVKRDGKTAQHTLMREKIQFPLLEIKEIDNLLYIRLPHFHHKKTAELLAKKFQQYPKISGLVLDLRNNGGGLMDQGIDVANLFLCGGTIVFIKGRTGLKKISASPSCLLKNIPMIVLINHRTASAAEIVAAALKTQRALVVGTTSYGKASIQSIFPLERGGGALSLTTDYYVTPYYKNIHGKGIAPDIKINEDIKKDTALAYALKWLKTGKKK